MRQKDLLESIQKHLSRFESQVKISTANNEYDIGIHSENVIIPILNIIFDTNLVNTNYSEEKNSEAIDLIDETKRLAFQITSTKKIEKIKKTLSKFIGSKYKSKVDTLIVYIISEKQAQYSQVALDKVAEKKIRFSSREHIIDHKDIYRKIAELNDFSKIEKIEELLRLQFSDVVISKTFKLSDLDQFKTGYIESCITNFSRINFFGLSVSYIKPREIELYRLFVYPKFQSLQSNRARRFHTDEYFTIPEAIETDRYLIHSTPTVIDHDVKIKLDYSKYFLDKNIVKLMDYDSISNLRLFISDLNEREQINFSDLFMNDKHIVVIGKPGAGKSSFIKYAICKILQNDHHTFSSSEIYDTLPFRVELHKYNKFKKDGDGGIVEYLSELLKSDYQQTLSVENIIAVIKSFPTIFFFDGLDEIFDIQDRIQVRNDIETFVGQFDNIRSVVTSRFESYEEVQLSEKYFSVYEILDFNESQVDEYVKKWYDIEAENEALKNSESANCLRQLKNVDPELKYNPLLLSLILLLYRNELDIPTSKLSIYESCTNTIVETRDVKEKKLDIKLKILNKISVFASLAYWQFVGDSKGEGTPTFDTVKSYIKNYLIEKGEFNDEAIAQQATVEFMDFAKVRSIYFENKFTHKTFLEYFTAYYIYSYFYGNWKKAEDFSSLISNYLGLSAWSVVLELLICKIDSSQINYEVIDDLIDKQFEKNKIDSLIFFLQILKYLKNISPKKIQFVIDNSIAFCFKDGETTKESKVDYQELLFSSLASLASVDRFREIIEKSFSALIDSNTVDKTNLSYFAYEFAITSGSPTLVKILQDKNAQVNTQYLFILQHFPNLFDKGKYLESLKLFIGTFSSIKTQDTYKSPFRQKIVFNSPQFNWVTSFIANNIGKSSIKEIWEDLITVGVTNDDLLAALEKDNVAIDKFELQTKLDSNTYKNSNLNKVIKALRKKYLLPSVKKKTEGKFYEKFYINPFKFKRNMR